MENQKGLKNKKSKTVNTEVSVEDHFLSEVVNPVASYQQEVEEDFDLPNGVVIIRPLSQVNMADKNLKERNNFHVSVLPKCQKRYDILVDDNGFFKTGLSTKEISWLSKLIGKELGRTAAGYTFWSNYSLHFSDNEVKLNLSHPEHYLKYKVIQAYYPTFATPDKVTHDTVYLIINQEAEEERRISKTDKMYEALNILKNNMDQVEQAKFLRLFGKPTHTLKPRTILSMLEDIATTSPQLFLDTYNDNLREQKQETEAMLHAGIIHKKDGRYWFEEIALGTSIGTVAAWMKDAELNENSDILSRMETLLKEYVVKKGIV